VGFCGVTAEGAEIRKMGPFLTVFPHVFAGESFRTIDRFFTGSDTEEVWPAIPLCSGAGSRCITAPATFFCPLPGYLWLIRGVPFSWSKAWCNVVRRDISAGKFPINLLCGLTKSRKARSQGIRRLAPTKVRASRMVRQGAPHPARPHPPRPELRRCFLSPTAPRPLDALFVFQKPACVVIE